MKQRDSFWQSIERYGWLVIGRVSPLLPSLVGMIVLLMMLMSFMSQMRSVAALHSLTEVIEKAARVGDYPLAQKLEREIGAAHLSGVLGVNSELESLVYPERVILREIKGYEQLLAQYPGHRDIYLVLAELYERVNDSEKANEYWELAKMLDPNNAIFK